MGGNYELQGPLITIGVDISEGSWNKFEPETFPPQVEGTRTPQIRSTVTTIGLAALLASNTTPVDLVAAPGAGKANIFYGAEWFLNYGSVIITAGAGDDQVIAYDTGADVCLPIDDTLFIVLAADTYYWTPPVNGLVVANKKLQFETQNSDMTGGTGSVLQITCYYDVVTLQT